MLFFRYFAGITVVLWSEMKSSSSSSSSNRKGWKYKFLKNKVILLVLLWLFSTNLFNYLFVKPVLYHQTANIGISTAAAFATSLIFLLSPLTGYLADVWFGRRKTIISGTYIMLLSVICIFIIGVIFMVTFHKFSTAANTLLALLVIFIVIYTFGNVFFLSNIIQFGTDQLRDSPTRYSTFFVQAFFWTENVCSLVATSAALDNFRYAVDALHKVIFFSRASIIMTGSMVLLSILLMSAVLFIAHRKSHSFFLSENRAEDPYKLISKVMCFAIRHNKPIRRSAFTFWENTRPSRLDFGKQRYGGPYTTEQVENVKVLLNILKVILALGPFFFLEGTSHFLIVSHANINATEDSNFKFQFKNALLGNGMLIPLLPVICMPVFYVLFKNFYLAVSFPNMFKKIGLAYGILVISYVMLCVCDFISFSCINNMMICTENTRYLLNHHYFTIPNIYMSLIQQVLFSFNQMLFYPPVYEFICCQSPQHMKGLVFGFFYAWKSFQQLLGTAFLYGFSGIHWNSHVLSNTGVYYAIHVSIGVIAFIVYVAVSRKYRYRKRDDICNYYTFAENYYSTTP